MFHHNGKFPDAFGTRGFYVFLAHHFRKPGARLLDKAAHYIEAKYDRRKQQMPCQHADGFGSRRRHTYPKRAVRSS